MRNLVVCRNRFCHGSFYPNNCCKYELNKIEVFIAFVSLYLIVLASRDADEIHACYPVLLFMSFLLALSPVLANFYCRKGAI